MLLKVALLMWDYPITGVTEIRINSISDTILTALLSEREREKRTCFCTDLEWVKDRNSPEARLTLH